MFYKESEIKRREILFSKILPSQVEDAVKELNGLENVKAEKIKEKCSLTVEYNLKEHSLYDLEVFLQQKGFILDESFFNKIIRSMVYYAEEIELTNLKG